MTEPEFSALQLIFFYVRRTDINMDGFSDVDTVVDVFLTSVIFVSVDNFHICYFSV